MMSDDLEAIRSRINRAFDAVKDASGAGYEISYQVEGTEFTTNFRAVGIKAPEKIEDDFLNLFIWMWSLKDYLKSHYKAKGLAESLVEDEVNNCPALMYVADIANRAKHGVLRESRSNVFAELVDIGFNMPQDSIEKITVMGPDLIVMVKKPEAVSIRAFVVINNGSRFNALDVLTEAMDCWENNVLQKVKSLAKQKNQ